MRNANIEQRRGSGARGHFVAAVLFTLAAGGAWFAINRENIQEYMETHKNREAEISEIANLKQRIGQLKRKQQSLGSNGVESKKQIRERLQLKMPGEKVVFFVEEGEKPSTATVPKEQFGTETPVDVETQGSPARNAEPKRKTEDTGEIRSVYDAM